MSSYFEVKIECTPPAAKIEQVQLTVTGEHEGLITGDQKKIK